jgi:lysyl-tRNA synthetase, class I
MEERSKDELKDKHWSDLLVDEVLETKKPPLIVNGGISTSGPVHFGTVSEFLYPFFVTNAIKERGQDATFIFVGDIVDPFKGVPAALSAYKDKLTPELGKPMSNVIDPMGCHKSYGHHYLAEAVDIMKVMGVSAKIVASNDLYESGAFDQYTRLYFKNEEKVRNAIAKSSLKSPEDMKNWDIIMAICANCGKVITTRLTWHNDEEYEYVCDKDVVYTKGCNFKGRNKISDHKYKLQWRLHWPTWHAYFNTSIEGAGADHIGKGKSSDSATVIAREILNREPPVFYKFGIVMLHGKKYSKSKGFGMGIDELLMLVPPEIVRYALAVPNLSQNKEIDPSGDKLVLLFEEVERLAKLEKPDNRADEKKQIAFKISVGKLKWKAPFLDMLLNYQIFKDWAKVSELVNDKEGVEHLSPYITEWLKRGFEPERYNFEVKPQKVIQLKEVVVKFTSALKPSMSDVDVHNLVYEVAKESNTNSNELFAVIYNAIIGKDKGPKLGKLIAAIGVEKTKGILESATAS